MAQRRMFSPDIVQSDAFLEMPPSTQALYFQLGMKADDDGFVNPRVVMRMIGSSDDELKVLIGKRFVLPFENGVIVIKHWKINNLVRKDFYKPTIYLEQREKLYLKENGSYTDDSSQGKRLVNEPLTQVRLGKVNKVNRYVSFEEEKLPIRVDVEEPRKSTKVDASGFGVFWEAYPHKADKLSALAEWKKLSPTDRAAALADVPARASSEMWLSEEGKYVPMAKKYLAGQRWNDPLPKKKLLFKKY